MEPVCFFLGNGMEWGVEVGYTDFLEMVRTGHYYELEKTKPDFKN